MAYTIPNNAYSHVNAPNTPRCTYTNSEDATDGAGRMCSAAPTSNHSGGVNVGFADGSVKFIKNTIALQTWWALGCAQPERGRRLGRVLNGSALHERTASIGVDRHRPRYYRCGRHSLAMVRSQVHNL